MITAANFEHASVMNTPHRRTDFEILLLEEMRGIHAETIAWVILPNHYHLLVDIESLDFVSAALKHLHGKTSRQWNLEDHLTEKRRVWYKFSDRLMRSEKQLAQTFNYIHFNPIKHGLTSVMEEWPWSSYKLYENSQGGDWLQVRWNSNPFPEEFGRGWDD